MDQAWWEILLQHQAASPAPVLESLRLFVRRAVERGVGRLANNDAFIEDITQDATLRIVNNLSAFRGDCQFTVWATTVAVRVAFTELRHAKWKDVSLNRLLYGDQGGSVNSRFEPQSDQQPVAQTLVRTELIASLHRVMERELSDRQRMAIDAELAGMPMAQLAEKMSTNSNALYKLLHDARRKIKQGLLADGTTEAEVRSMLAG